MAVLVSPGVNVSVVDESAYGVPVPYFPINGGDTMKQIPQEVKLMVLQNLQKCPLKFSKVTSQRELTQFLNLTFTKSGTRVVQGSETHEYGLWHIVIPQGNPHLLLEQI